MRYPMRLYTPWRPLLALFGGMQGRAYVDVQPEHVRFRFGPLFNQVIPRAQIAGAEAIDWPWWKGVGWRAWADTYGLIGAREGVVGVRLRSSRRAWLLFIPWRYRVIAVSLQDPEGFLGMINGAPG